MLTLYGDESHDDHTYALGGWLVTPTHYDILEAGWRKMLATITMPDGSPCPAFHAALMTNQRRSFARWTKEQALSAFNKATDVLAERPGRFAISACAVAAAIPDGVTGKDKDGIWMILFMKFFALVLQAFPAAAGITFVFDRKDEITKSALDGYAKVSGALARDFPNVFLEGMSFVDDEACAGVQAADLLVFEWRKRITDERLNPARAGSRPWFQRIREARPQGPLVQFDVAKQINERHYLSTIPPWLIGSCSAMRLGGTSACAPSGDLRQALLAVPSVEDSEGPLEELGISTPRNALRI